MKKLLSSFMGKSALAGGKREDVNNSDEEVKHSSSVHPKVFPSTTGQHAHLDQQHEEESQTSTKDKESTSDDNNQRE